MSDVFEDQLENIDWDQLPLEQLKKVQSQVSRAIDLKRNPQKTSNPQPESGYTAKISKIFPKTCDNHLTAYEKCIFIISLNGKNFTRKRLEASIRWISENFRSCIVFVADSIYRLTLKVRRQEPTVDHDFLLEARYVGQAFIKNNEELFKKYSRSCNFTFQLASETSKNTKFEAYYQKFRRLHQEDEPFAELVCSFAEDFLRRDQQVKALKLSEASELLIDYRRELAIAYLLEESALFTCLAETGSSVFVYPGSIKTFEEIAEGLHPEVPSFLQQIIWVSLRLKKKNNLSIVNPSK